MAANVGRINNDEHKTSTAPSIKLALSQLRDELDMSQAELAAIIGVQQPSIARMENADHDPLLSTLK